MSESLEQYLMRVSQNKGTALKYYELIKVAEKLGLEVISIEIDVTVGPNVVINECTLKLADSGH